MFSYIKSIFKYLFSYESEEIYYEEEYNLHKPIIRFQLEEELRESEDAIIQPSPVPIPKHRACYERRGVVTSLQEDSGIIDKTMYFDAYACRLNINLMDKVLYLCFKNEYDHIFVVRILKVVGEVWDLDDYVEDIDEKVFDTTEHTFVGEVDFRDEKLVFIKNTDLKFNLDCVSSTFVPIQGDWLELRCKIKFDAEMPMDTTFDTIIEVLSVKPLWRKKTGVVTEWDGDTGICDDQILFHKHCIIIDGPPTVGSKVYIEAIESNQGACQWRAIKIEVIHNNILSDNRAQEGGYSYFIATEPGTFAIPDKILKIVSGDSNERMNRRDYNIFISNIKARLPCLMQTLNIHNYTDRWHTLIHMEEIQNTIDLRSYDIQSGYLKRRQEYFGIKIKGFSEKRSLVIVGDKVIVNDIQDKSIPSYKGYVHFIKGDLVLLKFNQQFHKVYSGHQVSIHFKLNRTKFRRAHEAVDLAISNLGSDILFPNCINTKAFQIPKEKIDTIEWYNKCLNPDQKSAIKNILLGECRPLPYCIYGPPGTGKTITVIETILQILTLMPDSRILVATPSNIAANLVTEKLVQYSHSFSCSIIRIIANNMVDNENISDITKPYCASINISKEDAEDSSHKVKKGLYVNVSASYVARHRVCIGTCYSIGTMFHLVLPKGHFTHVIVDEAGQAAEPEIMVPMTFIDKENGQIILAGDPMQLGPRSLSKYCEEFGYNISYLTRLLETLPYQRDYNSFENGYNGKLFTRLAENYRSLEEVITLPSKMFYNSSLVPKLQRNKPWVGRLLDDISDVFEIPDNPKIGGIFVYGIKGCNRRTEDSPSWFNPEEADFIGKIASRLFRKNISMDNIGIVSPYTAQIKYIRRLFDDLHLPRAKIGTVEQFQGQERRIMIISTVWTSESEVAMDEKHALEFMNNPRRMNVALTRAQLAVLIFCDPHLLLTNLLWQHVINQAIQSGKYIGCDLPIYCDKRKLD